MGYGVLHFRSFDFCQVLPMSIHNLFEAWKFRSGSPKRNIVVLFFLCDYFFQFEGQEFEVFFLRQFLSTASVVVGSRFFASSQVSVLLDFCECLQMLFCLTGARWPPNFVFFVGACGPCEVFEVPLFCFLDGDLYSFFFLYIFC